MRLGDFFSSAPNCRPINPRSITITAICKGDVLPNGESNPHGVPVAATVKGGLVFIGGTGAEFARTNARKAIHDRHTDKKTGLRNYSEDDVWAEVDYQIVYLAVREWDGSKLGGRVFEGADEVREYLEPAEVRRVIEKYNEYVKEEHPADADADEKTEGVDHESFREG